jgi:DNA-binding XRE family transcriptional regulator
MGTHHLRTQVNNVGPGFGSGLPANRIFHRRHAGYETEHPASTHTAPLSSIRTSPVGHSIPGDGRRLVQFGATRLSSTSVANAAWALAEVSNVGSLTAAVSHHELRKAEGWSQEQFSAQAHVHRTFAGALERGEKNLSFHALLLIARCFNITMAELLTGIETGETPTPTPEIGRKHRHGSQPDSAGSGLPRGLSSHRVWQGNTGSIDAVDRRGGER